MLKEDTDQEMPTSQETAAEEPTVKTEEPVAEVDGKIRFNTPDVFICLHFRKLRLPIITWTMRIPSI